MTELCARLHWEVICADCATAEDSTGCYRDNELLCARCGRVAVDYIALPFAEYEALPRRKETKP